MCTSTPAAVLPDRHACAGQHYGAVCVFAVWRGIRKGFCPSAGQEAAVAHIVLPAAGGSALECPVVMPQCVQPASQGCSTGGQWVCVLEQSNVCTCQKRLVSDPGLAATQLNAAGLL